MFSDKQVDELRKPLDRSYVRERKQGGATLSYVEGWHAIAEANRIFGFGNWDREMVSFHCVWQGTRQTRSGDLPACTYVARVRVSAYCRAPDGSKVEHVMREGCGAGHGMGQTEGEAHESAIKEAETDAMKRALMTFGNPFGLALYDKDQRNVTSNTGQKPTTGKYKITQLKEEARKLGEDIRACEDHDSLVTLLAGKEQQAVMDQLITDLSQWWYGSGDNHGLQGLIETRKQELYAKAEKEKELEPNG